LVGPIEFFAKLRGATSPPVLTGAQIKFMTLNLDYSIEKAKRELGYRPTMDFQDGIKIALDWITGKEVKGRRSEVRENASDLRPLTSDA
jgi:nucleoside-diphosphate-sugar epimerase